MISKHLGARGGAAAQSWGNRSTQDMRPRRRQQPRGPEMIARLVGDDQIGRMLVVELVELEAAVEHRQSHFRRSTKTLLRSSNIARSVAVCDGWRIPLSTMTIDA